MYIHILILIFNLCSRSLRLLRRVSSPWRRSMCLPSRVCLCIQLQRYRPWWREPRRLLQYRLALIWPDWLRWRIPTTGTADPTCVLAIASTRRYSTIIPPSRSTLNYYYFITTIDTLLSSILYPLRSSIELPDLTLIMLAVILLQ